MEKTLYLINSDNDDYIQLKGLVEAGNTAANEVTKDIKTVENETEIITGTEGSGKPVTENAISDIRIVNYPDTLYLNDGIKADRKALFIGEIGDSSSSKKKVEYVFSEFGVRYGWASPTRAYIDIDDSLVKDKNVYSAFLEEYTKLPVIAARKGDATRRNKFGKFCMTFVLPFGFIKTIADSYGDAAAVRKQLHAYALIMFYNNHMEEFMNL